MASFTAILTLYLAVQLLVSETISLRRVAFMGASFGLAMLSRTTTLLYLLPICMLVILLCSGRSIKRILGAAALFSGVALAVCGWWYLHNFIEYGDPFLWRIYQSTVGWYDLRRDPMSVLYVVKTIAILNCSYWAYFGLEQYHATIWEYSVYVLLEVLALIGLFEGIKKGPSGLGTATGARQRAYWIVVLAFLIGFSMIFSILMRVNAPVGRFLFILVAPISILLSSGLLSITPELWRKRASVWISLFLCFYAFYLLLKYWYPHYV